MYSKKFIILTFTGTIILGLLYNFYVKKNKKKKDDKLNSNLFKKLELNKKTSDSELSDLDESDIDDNDTIQSFSNDSDDLNYFNDWSELLEDLGKQNVKIFDTHISNISLVKNYFPISDPRNHQNRFWISNI